MFISYKNPLRTEYYRDGQRFIIEYIDVDSFDTIELKKVQQVYGVCFHGSKMIIVRNGLRGTWGLVGGQREEGESIERTLKREIQEESNMDVIEWKPIGIQKVTDPENKSYYQLRTVCTVRPFGPFMSDPGGSVTEIKYIDPLTYKQYFDWQEIGEHIVRRAIQLKEHM